MRASCQVSSRLGARLFARAGFERIGEQWVDPEFGANVRMWREI
jgi:hypothetical protein